MFTQRSYQANFFDRNEQPMNLENTVNAPRRSMWETPVYALLLRRDSVSIYSVPKPNDNTILSLDYFDRKYALVARYPIDLFRVGPVEIFVRSQQSHVAKFYGAHVVHKPSQSA